MSSTTRWRRAHVGASGPPQPSRFAGSRLSVGVLSLRPGLTHLGDLLGQPATTKMLVVGQAELAASLECGAQERQTLLWSPSYSNGQAWFDTVQYEDATAGLGAEVWRLAALCYGKVRTILLYEEEDVVVLCKLEKVPSVQGCPLAERLCTRLAWGVGESATWGLEAVPLSRVRRVVHVVPDFADLGRRAGSKALPPS
eukprot:TRINITY_DN10331_c0_g1_i1.p2 TRINITY_DN10331_c0_g1~~TRINITY_DN10331_c0_g1_i1.p2  ORF type:complete len:198 (-),score=6.85 TRINITY_DN10331_c0_g1_i1:34-627(-)